MNKKVNKYINLDKLPMCTKGIDWIRSIGHIVNFTYGDNNGQVEILDYKDGFLYIKYDNEIYKKRIKEFKECSFGSIFNNCTKNFAFNANDIIKTDEHNLIITKQLRIEKYGFIRKYYEFKCNKCGWDKGIISERKLKIGFGCACCSGRQLVEGINDIPTTASWMIKYFQGGYEEAKLYTRCSEKRIYPICPDCGEIKSKTLTIYNIFCTHSIGCTCSDGISYPNKFAYNMLEQLEIKFIREYSPDWIKPKRYDFYFDLDNKKYILEMDGELGHGGKSFSNNTSTKDIDDYKDRMAEMNDITVIRIDSKLSDCDYIKNNIIDSDLNMLFDFNKVDWNKCHEYALTNIIKQVCNYKNNNQDLTSIQIGNVFDINFTTVIDYLKKGTQCGWCKYDAEEEKKKAFAKTKDRSDHNPVKCMQNDYVFRSATECHRKSLELFGVLLNTSNINDVLTGRYKHHKGFTFEHITKQEFNTIKTNSPELAFGEFFIIQNEE